MANEHGKQAARVSYRSVAMETVAFYSYKGGVGRTLLVANTAQFLALSGRRVVVLDLDFEAPGLHEKLGDEKVLRRASNGVLRGAIDELLHTLENSEGKSSLKEASVSVNLPVGSKGSLILIPAGSAPSQTYWASLERLQATLRSPHANGGLAEAVLELQARIADEFAPEFLLIDSRTGITELGGLATSLLSDRVVCLTTNTRESVKGTKVVAQALRDAPRLSSQQQLRIDFVLTRTPQGSGTNVKGLEEELGGSVAVLPHDSGITIKERVLSGSEGRSEARDDDDAGKKLFTATFEWIAKTFPGHEHEARKARLRMEAVHQAWQHLTNTTEHFGRWSTGRDAWPVTRLRERVRFEKDKKTREADIVAYDLPADTRGAAPLMIVEYVNDEDRDGVARWWFRATPVTVVAVLSEGAENKLYSKKTVWDSRSHHSNRWDIPLPSDFDALADPTDVSVDALLDAVRRGHDNYLDRIVHEWVRSSAATLHGGMPWKPQIAKKIIDALARVEETKLARRVLWAASGNSRRRHRGMGDFEDGSEDQVRADLFAPLLWRLPVDASIEILQESSHHRGMKGMGTGSSPGLVALDLLARDTLGLKYDPDAFFRTEGQRILDRSPKNSDVDEDRGLYQLSERFRSTEISFELSDDLPSLLEPFTEDDDHHVNFLSLSSALSERIANNNLVTTGLLGEYQAKSGTVIIYQRAISECAGKLALQERHVGSVTLIHETIHALAHLGRDLDGRMWTEFSLPPKHDTVFQPNWSHQALTQYFTFHHIRQLDDPALTHAFEVMSSKQAPAYRAWQRIKGMPMEDARNWFMSVRRGVGGSSPWAHLLFDSSFRA